MERNGRSRRQVPQLFITRAAARLAMVLTIGLASTPIAPAALQQNPAVSPYALRADDRVLLDDIETSSIRFFLEQSDPQTGLTRDRAPTQGGPLPAPASIAATGFALTAWCIADFQSRLPAGEALRRVRTTLEYTLQHVEEVHGWLYHFLDPRTGRRAGLSEISTIDTALFLQGAIFAREYLNDPGVSELVARLYRRIDWQWAQNGRLTLVMGWQPESGFTKYRWDSYSELMGLYLLGLGAPSHPLPPAAWDAWRRPRATIAGHTYIYCGPLFTHQYAHAWFDFRGVHDRYTNYWRNSVDATLAQRAWSAAQTTRFPHWSADLWGLTASDGPHGYTTWGTPGPDEDESDGTLVPCAPAGSLPFAPRECLTVLRRMRTMGANIWGRYGYADAFNPETGWVSANVIGIDIGITLVMAENLRSGLVWRHFMRAPEVRRGMNLAGFTRSGRDLPANRIVERGRDGEDPAGIRSAFIRRSSAPAEWIRPGPASAYAAAETARVSLPIRTAAATVTETLAADLGGSDTDRDVMRWVSGPDVETPPVPRPPAAPATDEHRDFAVYVPRTWTRGHLLGAALCCRMRHKRDRRARRNAGGHD